MSVLRCKSIKLFFFLIKIQDLGIPNFHACGKSCFSKHFIETVENFNYMFENVLKINVKILSVEKQILRIRFLGLVYTG